MSKQCVYMSWSGRQFKVAISEFGVWYLFDVGQPTLFYGPSNYMTKLMEQCESIHGWKSHKYSSSLEKVCHPEINTTEAYHNIIGCLNFVVPRGRFDLILQQ